MIRRKNISDVAKQVVDKAENGKRKKPAINVANLVPSGVTGIDLICSDNLAGAFHVGRIYNIVGDSSSGKTLLALTILAAIANCKRFDDYELAYDDVEHALNFDLSRMFGDKLNDRLEPPGGYNDDDEPINSNVVEDFFLYIRQLVNERIPFVYVLDSLDALDTKADSKKEDEVLDKHAKGKDSTSSNIGVKARQLSRFFARFKKDIAENKSVLIIISQTRDKMDAGKFQKKTTRSGGKALRFYSQIEMWLSTIKTLKTTINEVKHPIGQRVLVKIEKNKLTGKKHKKFIFDVYYDLGIDDVAACIDWLVENSIWRKKKNTIVASDLNIEASRKKLIEIIEDENLEPKLRRAMAKAWKNIEDQLKLNRKRRFK
jgi:RecA/RadA recombinase